MSRLSGDEQDRANLARDWERVGGYLSLALDEVATCLGGEDFASSITESASMPDTTWPNPTALETLDGLFPGSAEQVLSRSEAIQKEIHERELAELNKPSARKYGKAILQGLVNLNLFGIPLIKR